MIGPLLGFRLGLRLRFGFGFRFRFGLRSCLGCGLRTRVGFSLRLCLGICIGTCTGFSLGFPLILLQRAILASFLGSRFPISDKIIVEFLLTLQNLPSGLIFLRRFRTNASAYRGKIAVITCNDFLLLFT